MFTFFRKYQRFIYLVVTAVIILSFSFFGTYSAFTSGKGEDPVVLKTVAGKKITRSDFNDYVHFFSMDALTSEGHPGNALNDGVLERDIIGSPIGEVLVNQFAPIFIKEWEQRLKREKQFQPYRHPQAAFLSAQQAWSYFAPNVKTSLEEYQQGSFENPIDLYKKKRDLFLAEKRFPANYLRQVLLYQQMQFEWLEPDVALEGRSLSLFGYQQLTDWFGQSFVDKSTEFIIQMAAKARLMGISVSQGEVIASLYQNAQEAAKQLGPNVKVTPDELMKKTLLSLGMDESRAVKVWGDVLLFRRALLELPQKIVLSPDVFVERVKSDAQTVEVEEFQLQPCLRLTSLLDLMKVETWLNAVTKKQAELPLIPSPYFRSCEEVSSSFPEFVERRFVLSVAEVDLKKLETQVRLKDVWMWQNDHWEDLEKEIPALKNCGLNDKEARFQALENLSPEQRGKADEMARHALVASDLQKISSYLDAAKPETKVYSIRLQGGSFPFEGIKNRREFLSELSKAPISERVPGISQYTQDNQHFYRISILDRKSTEELIPLPDLLADGTLESVLDRILEASYERVRSDKPNEFRNSDGTWKPFKEVKEKVGEIYFAPFFKKLDIATKEWKGKIPSYCEWDNPKVARVAVRFLPLISEEAECLRVHGPEGCNVTDIYAPTDSSLLTLERRPLADIYSLVKSAESFDRRNLKEHPGFKGVFELGEGAWLPVRYSHHLGPFVARVKSLCHDEYKDKLRRTIYDLQDRIGEDVIRAKAKVYTQEFFGNDKKDHS